MYFQRRTWATWWRGQSSAGGTFIMPPEVSRSHYLTSLSSPFPVLPVLSELSM